MVKILVSCASGSGTSMLMKLSCEKACKAMGITAQVAHAPVAEAKSSAKNYDIVITSPAFAKNFDSLNGVKVGYVKNPVSQAEYEKVLKENGLA